MWDVDSLSERLTRRHLLEWLAFFALEPLAAPDLAAARICATTAEVMAKKRDGTGFTVADFVPDPAKIVVELERQRDRQQQSPEAVKARQLEFFHRLRKSSDG